MRKLYESLDLFCRIKSKQGRAGQVTGWQIISKAGQDRVRKKITGQGRIQIIKILAGQVTGYQNTSTCRALLVIDCKVLKK